MSRPASAPFWLPPESDVPEPASFHSWGPWLALALMVLVFAVGFCWLSLERHAAFQSHAFDLGNMDQAVWNTLHGPPLRFTDMTAGHGVLTTRLAIHVEPVLFVLAMLYVIHTGPETLLVVQAIVVATGALPAYLLARRAVIQPWLSLAFPLAYLVHPSLQSAVLDDFHPVTLCACFLLWATYFAWTNSLAGFAPFAVLAATTKEDIGLLVAALGVVFLIHRRWYVGLMTIICGIGWFTLCVLVIIPAFNPTGQSPYLLRYRYLGQGVFGVLTGAALHPAVVWHVLTSGSRLAFLNTLLDPAGYVSLLGLPVLLLALPSFAIDMLSADAHMYSGYYQYPAEIVPYVIAAAAVGTGATARFAADWRVSGASWMAPSLAGLVTAASLASAYLYGSTPLSRGYLVPAAGPHQSIEAAVLRHVPPAAPVAAADEIEPHLSDRQTIYLLPTTHPANGPPAQYVILDASIPSLPIQPHTLHAAAVNLLRQGFGVMAARDGIVLLRAGKRTSLLPKSFFTFLFARGSRVSPVRARWKALSLVGVTVHPRDRLVTPVRPAIEVESYWRLARPLRRPARIVFYLSPVYNGRHPPLSARWRTEGDSPAWAWLPLSRWPPGRTVRALSLPLIPSGHGRVDVAVGVWGQGPATGLAGLGRVPRAAWLVRVATVQVGY